MEGESQFYNDVARVELAIDNAIRNAINYYDQRKVHPFIKIQIALSDREAFTIVEGVEPKDFYRGRIDAELLLHKLLRHEQSTLAIEQVRLYAVHNGRMLNGGRSFELEPIAPHEGFEHPVVLQIPEKLMDDDGREQSTTLDGTRPNGRLILFTSQDNMYRRHKELRPRWKVTYRTEFQIIGSKGVAELVPSTPGKEFVYATVELSALEPDYVALGRVRPNDGPLMVAVDAFVGEQIRELAKRIHERRRRARRARAPDMRAAVRS